MKIFKCLRCEHEWASKQDRPTVCPKCKTPYWDKVKKKEKLITKHIFIKRRESLIRDNLKNEQTNMITPEIQKKLNNTGRNDPCPCGAKWPDGNIKKFKYCHGK